MDIEAECLTAKTPDRYECMLGFSCEKRQTNVDLTLFQSRGPAWLPSLFAARHTPAGIWCQNDVVSTSMRRRIDVNTTSFSHQMSAGTIGGCGEGRMLYPSSSGNLFYGSSILLVLIVHVSNFVCL